LNEVEGKYMQLQICGAGSYPRECSSQKSKKYTAKGPGFISH